MRDLHAPPAPEVRSAPPSGEQAPGLAALLRPLLPLYLVIHVGFVGYGMMTVLFTHMLLQGKGELLPAGAGMQQRTAVLGILLALYPAAQFFGTPFLSGMSDRRGRRPVLLGSITATSGCYLLIALALALNSVLLLGIALLLCGLGEANVAIAQSAIADVSPPQERGRLFGYIYIAVRMGYVTGPLLGGWLMAAGHSAALPFAAVALLLVGALGWTHARFAETHPPSATAASPGWIAGIRKLLSDRSIRALYLLNFVLYVAIFGYSRTIVVFLSGQWGMGVGEITLFYTLFAAAVLVANLGLMPLLSRRLGLARLAGIAAVTGGFSTIAVALVDSRPALWFFVIASSCLLSLCLSSCAALLSDSTPAAQQGEAMGGNEALQVAGQALGAGAGGLLSGISLQMPVVLSGAMVIAAALLLAHRSSRGAATASH